MNFKVTVIVPRALTLDKRDLRKRAGKAFRRTATRLRKMLKGGVGGDGKRLQDLKLTNMPKQLKYIAKRGVIEPKGVIPGRKLTWYGLMQILISGRTKGRVQVRPRQDIMGTTVDSAIKMTAAKELQKDLDKRPVKLGMKGTRKVGGK